MHTQWNKTFTLLGTAGVGAGLMYLLDPETGNRRRALLKDKMSRSANLTGEAIGTTWRDARNRAQGLVTFVQSAWSTKAVGDNVLKERIRSAIGPVVRHPRSIEVAVSDGWVTLSGPILAHEVDRLIERARKVKGVHGVDNRLDVHTGSGNIPGLQGHPPRPKSGEQFELMQVSWAPTWRLAAALVGGTVTFYGLSRRTWSSAAVAAFGAMLFGRALTNLELKRLFGIAAGRRAIDLNKSMTIGAPLEEVFGFWADYTNFPRFMSRVQNVRDLGDGRSRWTVLTPGGLTVSWTAVLTRFEPNRELAWKTEPDSAIQHAGIVKFTDNGDETTTIHLRMTYNPPAGALAHGLASLVGSDPKTLLDEDLMRMKSAIETDIRPRDAQQTSQELGQI